MSDLATYAPAPPVGNRSCARKNCKHRAPVLATHAIDVSSIEEGGWFPICAAAVDGARAIGFPVHPILYADEAEATIDPNAEPRDRDSDGAFDYDAQGMTEYDRESITAAERGHLLR